MVIYVLGGKYALREVELVESVLRFCVGLGEAEREINREVAIVRGGGGVGRGLIVIVIVIVIVVAIAIVAAPASLGSGLKLFEEVYVKLELEL